MGMRPLVFIDVHVVTIICICISSRLPVVLAQRDFCAVLCMFLLRTNTKCEGIVCCVVWCGVVCLWRGVVCITLRGFSFVASM